MKLIIKNSSLALLLVVSSQIFADPQEPARDHQDTDKTPLEQQEPAKSPDKQAEVQLDYNNAFDLARDFFDIHVKTDKDMKYWIRQLTGLIKKKGTADRERLKPFFKEFHTAHSTRDALGIGRAFQNHKNEFKEPKLAAHIDKIIKRDGLNSLLVILKKRMNIR
jgi:hypothetical protein